MSEKSETPKFTRKRAIELYCHACSGEYFDGMVDCGDRGCPLYTDMPYRKKEPDLGIFLYSPRAVGKVLAADRAGRKMTEKQKQAARERMLKLHKEGKL